MTRAAKWLSIGLLAGAALSCDPRRFDDLEDTAWVQLAERNDGQASGDWAIDVLAMPPDSGKQGMKYIVSLGSPPPGLSQVTFDEHGSITEQIGSNFQGGGAGITGPLDDKASVDSLAAYGATQFIAGAGDKPQTVRLDVGLKNGASLIPASAGLSKAGRAVAVGITDLNTVATTPDVVVMGQLTLSILPNGDPTKIRSCSTKLPNGAPANSLYIGWQTVTLAKVKGGAKDQIVMSGFLLDNSPFIYILDGSDIAVSAVSPPPVCAGTPGVNGFKVADPPPNAIAVADVDGDGKLDLIAGAAAMSGTAGTVTFYKGPLAGGTPTATVIPAPTEDSPSFLRGNRIKVADLDGDGKPEIMVADSGASLSNVNESGQVHVYQFGACSGAGVARGPFCLVNTLYDSTPSNRDQFGRAMDVVPFPMPSSTTHVLAVAEKNKLWVYFKIFPNQVDPRAK